MTDKATVHIMWAYGERGRGLHPDHIGHLSQIFKKLSLVVFECLLW